MKSLFNEYEAMEEEANELDNEARPFIGTLIKKWIDKGYLTRDIELVLYNVIATESSFLILKRAMDKKKEEREVARKNMELRRSLGLDQTS